MALIIIIFLKFIVRKLLIKLLVVYVFSLSLLSASKI